jgi:lipocalin
MGTWYEIARLPHRFQKDCYASRAAYTLRPDGEVDVVNSCYKGGPSGPLSEAHARARRQPGASPGQLEVSFFWPMWAHYWIIELAPDYSYAVVGHPGRRYLWILSRTPHMAPQQYQDIVARMQALGFPTQQLVRSDPSAGS